MPSRNNPANSGQGKPAPATDTRSFFQRLFSIIKGVSDKEKEKKKLLNEIAKSVKKSKPRYYSPKNGSVNPNLARFFFECYKTFAPAHTILSHADSSTALKNIIIEETFTPEQKVLKGKLSEEAIIAKADQTDFKMLLQSIKVDIKTFFANFGISRINQINSDYQNLSVLLDLVSFDYFFLLKKFDAALPEATFSYKPRFEAINGNYIIDELKDFLEILPAVDHQVKWEPILDVFRIYRGVEVIPRNSLYKLMQHIGQIRKLRVLEKITQLIEEKPFFKVKPRIYKEKIAEAYLSNLKIQTEMIIQKISREKRTGKIDSLAKKIFGTALVSRLANYSEKANLLFSKKMLGGYTYVTPLNYLKAFLLDYVKKDARQLTDILLIPAKWTNNLPSQQLSEAFHQLQTLSDELMKFDTQLSEDEENGRKIKSLIYKLERDKKATTLLRKMLKEINDQARALIIRSAQQCITLGKGLKMIMEDYSKQHPELIMNWKEVQSRSDENIKEMILTVYKQLYYFVQLMQFFVK